LRNREFNDKKHKQVKFVSAEIHLGTPANSIAPKKRDPNAAPPDLPANAKSPFLGASVFPGLKFAEWRALISVLTIPIMRSKDFRNGRTGIRSYGWLQLKSCGLPSKTFRSSHHPLKSIDMPWKEK
jgi:hypothetical protein